MLLDYLWDWISTHAPHAGSDTTSIRPMAACPNFNSRSPCRERPLVAGKEMLLLLFQSTLPLRGATAAAILKIHRLPISTHAPHAGSDFEFNGQVLHLFLFQPTLPMRGATISSDEPGFHFIYFNPRSPCGERRQRHQDPYGSHKISTHAPHAGSDLTSSFASRVFLKFQPTLPMRGATIYLSRWSWRISISTHAPHAGSDHQLPGVH